MKFKGLFVVLALLGVWSGDARAEMIKPVSNEKMCLTPGLSYPLQEAITDGILIFLQPCDKLNPLMDFKVMGIDGGPPEVEVRLSILTGGRVLCLQPYDGHPTDRTQLTARVCSGLQFQLWRPSYSSSGALTLQLVAEQAGGPPVCMDSAGGETKFGIQVQLATCNGGPTQQFGM